MSAEPEPPPHETRLVVPPPKKAGPLSGGAGLALGIVLLAAAGALIYNTYWRASADEPVESARFYMCSGDGNVFAYAMKKGESVPIACPACKKTTAFPAEACYWTRDGGTKDKPTYVILNRHLKRDGPTICPDCGREVVGHNPDPRKSGARVEPAAASSTQPAASPAKTERDR